MLRKLAYQGKPPGFAGGYLVRILVLVVVTLHMSFAAATEYGALGMASLSADGAKGVLAITGTQPDETTVDLGLGNDGDYFDLMCASIPSPLVVIFVQPPPHVAATRLSLKRAALFSCRPERPQWHSPL